MKKWIGAIALLVMLAGGFLGYQGYERNRQSELFAEASVYFTEEDYQKAIQIFDEAYSHDNLFTGSMDEELALYQAEAYLELGEYGQAIEIYNQFIGEYPKEGENYVLKGYCYNKLKEYGKEAATYEEAYENTGDGEFLLRQCDMYIDTGEYDKALEFIAGSKDARGATKKKLLFYEIVIYEKRQDYQTAYEKAEEFAERYPDDEDGVREKEFLESRK